MRITFLLFIAIVAFISCKKEASPDLGMSDESLVALIQDMHIANALILKYKKEHKDSVGQILRNQMAEIHNISEEEIDFIMEELQRSPRKYLELEKKAVANLKVLKDSLKTIPVQTNLSKKSKWGQKPNTKNR